MPHPTVWLGRLRGGRPKSLAVAGGALVAAVLAGCGGSGGRPAATANRAGPPAAAAGNPAPFAWLVPGAAPAGWRLATIAGGTATLAFPPGWKPTTADAGTVSAATLDRRGGFRGYLNVTPQQGTEAPPGWAAFRVARNREEGSGRVVAVAAAEHLRFAGASGSCVIDDYSSRVGGNRYRELACIVAGRTTTAVLIGAAAPRDWPTVGRLIERSASAFTVR